MVLARTIVPVSQERGLGSGKIVFLVVRLGGSLEWVSQERTVG